MPNSLGILVPPQGFWHPPCNREYGTRTHYSLGNMAPHANFSSVSSRHTDVCIVASRLVIALNFTGWHPLVKGVSYSLGNMAPSRKFSSTVIDLLEISYTIEKLIVSVCRYYYGIKVCLQCRTPSTSRNVFACFRMTPKYSW